MKRRLLFGCLVALAAACNALADGNHTDCEVLTTCLTGCSLHGSCVNYRCICEKGWTGVDCELRACGDECGTAEQVAGYTSYTIGNFTTNRSGWYSFCSGESGEGCRCGSGYSGSSEKGCRDLECRLSRDGYSGACCMRNGLCYDPASNQYTEYDPEQPDEPSEYVDLVPVWPSYGRWEVDEIDIQNCSCALREGCIDKSGRRRLLRFDTFILNNGTADLFIGAPGESDQMNFYFDTCHGHAHSSYTAVYELRSGDQTVLGSHKQGFCFMDTMKFQGNRPPIFDCDFQGITAGWMDVYGKHLDCQWIDITDLPGGNYTLVMSINPTRALVERTYLNNILRIPISLDGPALPPTTGTSGTSGTSGTTGTTGTTATTAAPATTAKIDTSETTGSTGKIETTSASETKPTTGTESETTKKFITTRSAVSAASYPFSSVLELCLGVLCLIAVFATSGMTGIC